MPGPSCVALKLLGCPLLLEPEGKGGVEVVL